MEIIIKTNKSLSKGVKSIISYSMKHNKAALTSLRCSKYVFPKQRCPYILICMPSVHFAQESCSSYQSIAREIGTEMTKILRSNGQPSLPETCCDHVHLRHIYI